LPAAHAERVGGRLQQVCETHFGEPTRDVGFGLRSVSERSTNPHASRPQCALVVALDRLGPLKRRRLEDVAVGVAVEGEAAADRARACSQERSLLAPL
jgi:hypothetical protein